MIEVILLSEICVALEVCCKSHLAFSGALSHHIRSLATLKLRHWGDHVGRSHGDRDAGGNPSIPAQEPLIFSVSCHFLMPTPATV